MLTDAPARVATKRKVRESGQVSLEMVSPAFWPKRPEVLVVRLVVVDGPLCRDNNCPLGKVIVTEFDVRDRFPEGSSGLAGTPASLP